MPSPRPVVPEHPDRRRDPGMLAPERRQLDEWLDLYRETVLLKIAGLNAEQLATRSVEPSSLSLLGLVRHLAFVERYWLRTVLQGDAELPALYCPDDAPDAAFEDTYAAGAEQDVAVYEQEIALTRGLTASWHDLDAPSRGLRRGEGVNLRWILVHLIEEYARHLGHMDLLRERIDGRTGY